jgi:predicted metal-dependent HD superfamily phosphohydrolase
VTLDLDLRWRDLWRHACLKGDPDVESRDLARAYLEPPRAYHNLDHIASCLKDLTESVGLEPVPIAVEIALWFHDAVYDPKARDNERQSAELALGFCRRTHVDPAVSNTVERLILSSTHETSPSDPDGKLFSDVDLGILGKPPEEFWEYERKIRLEYEWVPEAAFKEGRRRILRRFLERTSIYSTDFFREKYEVQARANLAASIAKLERVA